MNDDYQCGGVMLCETVEVSESKQWHACLFTYKVCDSLLFVLVPCYVK